MIYLYIAIGGALGACLRYALQQQFSSVSQHFPYGTLFANLLGSCLIGAVLAYTIHHQQLPDNLRVLVITGFLGALTTFSTFSMDNIIFIQQGLWSRAIINISLNLVLCLVGTFLAYQLVKGT